MNRRKFVHVSSGAVAAALLGQSTCAAEVLGAREAVEQAHAEIWRRFIDRFGIMLDFAGFDGKVIYPTPAECREGKPNALGWWSPIENGAMFNGLYLDAAVNRWRATKANADAEKARRLMEGLLLLNSISEVPGFVGRGVAEDGRSHYPMGSNDQTLPWFFGLWRYLQAGPATDSERTRIVAKMVETAEAILALGWKMPAEEPFGTRGNFAGFEFDDASRLLFVAKVIAVLGGSPKWQAIYTQALAEAGADGRTRRQICEGGMVFHYAKYHSWTSCGSVAALRGLWELEQEPELRAAFARGLQASADLAEKSLAVASSFDRHSVEPFDLDWRTTMLPLWQPQRTPKEAVDLAMRQIREFQKTSPRRGRETHFVREPTSAAWVVTLAPDREILRRRSAAVERVLAAYDYTKLYYSQFFWVEAAWWRLREAQA